ncbi:MAG: hypothetical protein H0U15_07015 [Geodermatophilaceae bacterium]|jgi:hypothetical protein|nr:hypothetical protein [Geodermatophilaceae bacterium]
MPTRASYDRFAVDELIRYRDGVVRTAELRALGMPAASITYRYRPGGPWQRLLPGIVLTHSGPPTVGQRLHAAFAYCGGGATLTGLAALRLYGAMHLPTDPALHVLVPHKRHRNSSGFVIVERTIRLPEHRKVRDFACAPIARAAIDASRRLTNLAQGRALLAEVVQRRMCSPRELTNELREAQIRGTALPRRVLREIRGGARSVAEADAKRVLAAHHLLPALWNCDIYDEHGQWLACPDAVWLELGVVLEIDSLEWHLSPADYQKTQARHRRMTAAGLLVIHVTPATIRDAAPEFLGELRRTLATAARRLPPRVTIHARAA